MEKESEKRVDVCIGVTDWLWYIPETSTTPQINYITIKIEKQNKKQTRGFKQKCGISQTDLQHNKLHLRSSPARQSWTERLGGDTSELRCGAVGWTTAGDGEPQLVMVGLLALLGPRTSVGGLAKPTVWLLSLMDSQNKDVAESGFRAVLSIISFSKQARNQSQMTELRIFRKLNWLETRLLMYKIHFASDAWQI